MGYFSKVWYMTILGCRRSNRIPIAKAKYRTTAVGEMRTLEIEWSARDFPNTT
jgi:hypothetical protein